MKITEKDEMHLASGESNAGQELVKKKKRPNFQKHHKNQIIIEETS